MAQGRDIVKILKFGSYPKHLAKGEGTAEEKLQCKRRSVRAPNKLINNTCKDVVRKITQVCSKVRLTRFSVSQQQMRKTIIGIGEGIARMIKDKTLLLCAYNDFVAAAASGARYCVVSGRSRTLEGHNGYWVQQLKNMCLSGSLTVPSFLPSLLLSSCQASHSALRSGVQYRPRN